MHAFLSHVGAHPHAALVIVFLAAFLEAVVIIGTVVPAGIAMFVAGTLVGAGALDLWITLGVAVAGAVAGDGLSYELGRIHAERIKSWRIFKRYSQALTRGEEFVRQNGGKSILLARFIAPMRAVVPVMAGFVHMPRPRFYAINIVSALLWAPAHVLPGVVFGASIRLAEAVTSRLMLVLLLLAALVWVVSWIVRISMRLVLPTARHWRERAVSWAIRRDSQFARVILFFLDPKRPESQELLVLALLLIASALLFFDILEGVVGRESLMQADIAIFHFFQSLRTSAVDRIMVGITELGEVGVLLPLAIVVSIWLIAHRCWRTAAYWLAAAGFSQIFVLVLKFTLGRQQATDLDAGIEQFSFPSGHATSSMAIYGFLAFLLSRSAPRTTRTVIIALAAVAVALIGFSRLYLGALRLSDVLGGFTLGLAWIAVLAMAYAHYRVNENIHPRQLGILAAVTLTVCGTWNIHSRSSSDLARYTPRVESRTLTTDQWIASGWMQIPLQRMETGGDLEEPLPLQWADRATDIARSLTSAGWQVAPRWSARTVLMWLSPELSVKDLPVLPKYNQGNRSALAFIYFDAKQPMSRIVLRLWRSNYTITNPPVADKTPVWYGSLYRENFVRPWHFLTLYTTEALAAQPCAPDFPCPKGLQWTSRSYEQNGSVRQAILILPHG